MRESREAMGELDYLRSKYSKRPIGRVGRIFYFHFHSHAQYVGGTKSWNYLCV